jgi:hypothetical protein
MRKDVSVLKKLQFPNYFTRSHVRHTSFLLPALPLYSLHLVVFLASAVCSLNALIALSLSQSCMQKNKTYNKKSQPEMNTNTSAHSFTISNNPQEEVHRVLSALSTVFNTTAAAPPHDDRGRSTVDLSHREDADRYLTQFQRSTVLG